MRSKLTSNPFRGTQRHSVATLVVTAAALSSATHSQAVLTFNVEPNGWDTPARRNAAIVALTDAINRFNAFGNFGNYNIYAYYNAGIPTAQASYQGSIGYGGTYPNLRVTLHEASHYLGTGSQGAWGNLMVKGLWRGSIATALVKQFDGDSAVLNGDTQHYWPYGLNYDSEGSEIAFQREVAMVYALRGDMGLGLATPASAVTSVTLTASDNLGQSAFNYANTWSDAHFAHPNADYSTSNFTLRTPASSNPYTFAGNSLTVNNTNGISGGLLYKGAGTTGAVTFKNLILNGGYVRHASSSADVFKLAGSVTLTGSPTLDAAQGAISLTATISGSGSFSKTGSFPLVLATGATYTGTTTISAGTLRLGAVAPVASYTFDNVSSATVTNTGTGGASMNGTLANGATVVPGGHTGSALSLASAASVDINNGILNLAPAGNWTVSAWVKTATPGATLLSKTGGGWEAGNTIFYLGDGTAGGSGGIPSSVRWGGGFFQGSASAANIANNAWHQITYVNAGGNYAIYVDGAAQPLSAGNSSLSAPDFSSIVRLGFSTNTVAGDGAFNFNGLLDDVQFYTQALSAPQVASLYQGAAVTGSLPPTTNLSIAAGATFDVNDATQQLASLTGPANSTVSLGSGKLTLSPTSPSTFSGNISGSSGSLIKSSSATLTLTGSNSYTGPTIVIAGTLALTKNAFTPLLNNPFGLDLQAGQVLLDYTGTTSPATAIASRISSDAIRSTTADATHTIGMSDNSSLSLVILKYTFFGDANLDRQVNADDYALLDRGLVKHLTGWSNGDFNYDDTINDQDYFLIDRAFIQRGAPIDPALLALRESQFGAAYLPSLLASIPEPTATTLATFAPFLSRRARR